MDHSIEIKENPPYIDVTLYMTRKKRQKNNNNNNNNNKQYTPEMPSLQLTVPVCCQFMQLFPIF